jgi:hypothetical protein
MKTKINKKIKEAARKYIKYLAYFMYFYFGWRLIAVPIIFFMGSRELTEFIFGGTIGFVLNLIIGIAFIIFGLISAYNLSKFKRWALTALTILISLHITSILLNSYLLLGKVKIPLIQIAILIFTIGGFKYLKNAQ